MRRLAHFFLIALAAAGLGGAGQPAPKPLIEFSDTDRADLDRVSAYLNSLRTLQGDFVQIGPDGQIDQGRFYIEKPGRVRFEYRAPNPVLIVSDGRTVAVANRKLKTVDRYPLSATPLDLILSDNLDLSHNNSILGVRHEVGALIVEARTSTNRSTPNLRLVFADPELELRQWTIVDDQGLPTTVALRDLQTGVFVDSQMFVLKDMKAPVGVKPRD